MLLLLYVIYILINASICLHVTLWQVSKCHNVIDIRSFVLVTLDHGINVPFEQRREYLCDLLMKQ